MPRSIADDLKQTLPFRTPSQEATVALMRTAHLLRRKLDALVEKQGITHQQYNVLRILRGARGPLPTMEIAERMIEPACGITRLISTLETRGFVRREQWGGDRRQVLCQITPSGLRVLEHLDDPLQAFDDALGTPLSSQELEVLISILARLRETLDTHD
jgi:DNA-binding MarR family transcriptional regulator